MGQHPALISNVCRLRPLIRQPFSVPDYPLHGNLPLAGHRDYGTYTEFTLTPSDAEDASHSANRPFSLFQCRVLLTSLVHLDLQTI